MCACVWSTYFVTVTHLNFNISSFLQCSYHWQCQHRRSPQIFHSAKQTEAFWSLCPLLRSAPTCNYDHKLYDSWKRYKTSFWMKILIRHMFNPEACVMERCNQQFIFRSSLRQKVAHLTWKIWFSFQLELSNILIYHYPDMRLYIVEFLDIFILWYGVSVHFSRFERLHYSILMYFLNSPDCSTCPDTY